MDKSNEIKISVRSLVEFMLRSGDLDNRFVGSSRALEGTKAHQKVQKAGEEEYIAEVAISHTFEYGGFVLTIDGRIDGVIIDSDRVLIDEIKSTTRPLDTIDEDTHPVYWAQALCYGYIYAEQNDLEELDIQLTYFQLNTEEVKHIVRTLSREALSEFFFGMVDKYLVWAGLLKDWSQRRDESIKKLPFPYEGYRRGQRDFAVAVYKTISEGKRLFVQAPTGVGKTISTLFPSVKAIGEGHGAKIFYLTAKTVTRQVAEEAFNIMKKKGLEFKSITLTAKEKICFKDETKCNPEYCEYARGYYDRVNAAMLEVLRLENTITRQEIEEYSRRHRICPFEFSLDLALFCDCIICDYNYAFDPRVYLKRFFMNKGGDYIFLVDEAHNLVDRSREMFSAELRKKAFLELKKLMKEKDKEIADMLNKLNSFMLGIRKQLGEKSCSVTPEQPADIYPMLREFAEFCEQYIAGRGSEDCRELLDLYFEVQSFLRIAELYDERYVTYMEKERDEVKLRLFCLDPSYLLREAFKKGRSAVLFSATLTPIAYFREILGGSEEDYTMRLSSPFERDRLCLFVADNVSTRYRNREASYRTIAEHIKCVIRQKQGNYLVFFPSYKYMNEIYEIFSRDYPEIGIIAQGTSMAEEEREAFLDRFQPDSEATLLGFAVMGGIFSEGIDLKGERLVGAIIVGVGLPQLCSERDIVMDYFNKKNGQGYEYSYMYPGMNKVLQAAGRVIRSEKDRGVVLLIDERFTNTSYLRLFPREWSGYRRITNTAELEKQLGSFWQESE